MTYAMKRIFKYLSLAAAGVSLLAGCMAPGRPLNFDVVTGDELYLPADGAFYNLSDVTSVDFYWAPSVAADNGYVTYEIVFDRVGGDFSRPLAVFASQLSGSSPGVSLRAKQLNSVARAAGATPGQRADFIWTVRAGKGLHPTVYGVSRTISLSPMSSMDPLPVRPLLKGAGAEDAEGVALSPAIAVDGVVSPEGTFECFTRIKGGTAFTVTDELDRHYLLKEGGILSNEAAPTPSEFASDAIYWLKIDFDGMSWSAVTVTDVVLYAAAWTGGTMKVKNTPMTYVGKGVWELLDYDNANSDNPEKDSRHRFNISLGNGTILYACTTGSLGTSYTQKYMNIEFFTALSNKDWDNTWTFLEKDCGRPLDCYLYLNADNAAGRFTHEYKFK